MSQNFNDKKLLKMYKKQFEKCLLEIDKLQDEVNIYKSSINNFKKRAEESVETYENDSNIKEVDYFYLLEFFDDIDAS